MQFVNATGGKNGRNVSEDSVMRVNSYEHTVLLRRSRYDLSEMHTSTRIVRSSSSPVVNTDARHV